MANALTLLTAEEEALLVEAIVKAEKKSSGEIRVHLELKAKKDVFVRAQEVFVALEMHKTAANNGILFYIATENKQFAIVGDKGIHACVGQSFWDDLALTLSDAFKSGAYLAGLRAAILQCGDQLKQYFPHQTNDQNELSNEISKGL